MYEINEIQIRMRKSVRESSDLPCPLDEDNRFDAFYPFDQDCLERTSLASFP